MRKIIVYSTLGKNAVEVNSQASEWAGVKAELKEFGVNYAGMKCVIGETRLTLESDKAIVPEGDFTLYLMPVKTKSGADRKELFALIKAHVEKNPSDKSKFVVDGKNMTQLSTPVLEQLVAKYISNTSASTSVPAKPADVKVEKKESPKPQPKAKPDTNVAGVVASVQSAKTEEVLAVVEETKAILDEEVDEEVATVIKAKLDLILELTGITVVSGEKAAPAPDKDAEKKKEQERLAKISQKCANEASDIMKDFSDVRR